MKVAITFITTLFSLSAYSTEPDKAKQDSIIDTAIQVADTIGTRKTLNDIRFDGWERSDWLDNEYIRTLRKYLDDYNSGKVSNTNLDPYKEQIIAVGYTAMWMKRKKRWKATSFVLSA